VSTIIPTNRCRRGQPVANRATTGTAATATSAPSGRIRKARPDSTPATNSQILRWAWIPRIAAAIANRYAARWGMSVRASAESWQNSAVVAARTAAISPTRQPKTSLVSTYVATTTASPPISVTAIAADCQLSTGSASRSAAIPTARTPRTAP